MGIFDNFLVKGSCFKDILVGYGVEVSAEVFLEWIFSNQFPFLIDIDIFKVECFCFGE